MSNKTRRALVRIGALVLLLSLLILESPTLRAVGGVAVGVVALLLLRALQDQRRPAESSVEEWDRKVTWSIVGVAAVVMAPFWLVDFDLWRGVAALTIGAIGLAAIFRFGKKGRHDGTVGT